MADDQVLNQNDIDKLMGEDGELDSDWDDDFEEDGGGGGGEEAASHAFNDLSAKSEPAPSAPTAPSASTKETKPERTLDFILDIPLEVSVELGRTRMVINDLLQLGQGSVIELTKLAGEPLEILVNNKLVARGEVVVVNEKFGVRVTDIVSPMERVKTLN
jgi:flagellar motor switch protein FliN/FliY